VALYVFESGAAHLQLGISRVFGVRGAENFDRPVRATNPGTFWHRWNITLSRWLRDYAYIPLGGNRQRKHSNLLLVFIYCGALHGLRPNCLAWGAWAGCTLALYVWFADRLRRNANSARSPRHWLVRTIFVTLARLGTIHWFCIGATIFLDGRHCGYRVLREYACRLAGLLAL
jgi:alginate O-acetyltransferase complex protein AlgI